MGVRAFVVAVAPWRRRPATRSAAPWSGCPPPPASPSARSGAAGASGSLGGRARGGSGASSASAPPPQRATAASCCWRPDAAGRSLRWRVRRRATECTPRGLEWARVPASGRGGAVRGHRVARRHAPPPAGSGAEGAASHGRTRRSARETWQIWRGVRTVVTVEGAVQVRRRLGAREPQRPVGAGGGGGGAHAAGGSGGAQRSRAGDAGGQSHRDGGSLGALVRLRASGACECGTVPPAEKAACDCPRPRCPAEAHVPSSQQQHPSPVKQQSRAAPASTSHQQRWRSPPSSSPRSLRRAAPLPGLPPAASPPPPPRARRGAQPRRRRPGAGVGEERTADVAGEPGVALRSPRRAVQAAGHHAAGAPGRHAAGRLRCARLSALSFASFARVTS